MLGAVANKTHNLTSLVTFVLTVLCELNPSDAIFGSDSANCAVFSFSTGTESAAPHRKVLLDLSQDVLEVVLERIDLPRFI